jgi:outer membrane lipoprotein-sorting protein
MIIFTLGFYIVNTSDRGKIDLKLKNQIGIIFINDNMILVQDENDATLLVIDDDKDINSLKKFKYSKLNVMMLNDKNLTLKYDAKIILNSNYNEDGIKYLKQDGLIYINYKDTNMCIYVGGNYNISNCEFVYFYNNDISSVVLHDYNEIILYYYKKPLSKNILQKIYDKSIDAYKMRDDELAIIKIGSNDYDFIVLNNE